MDPSKGSPGGRLPGLNGSSFVRGVLKAVRPALIGDPA